MKKPDPWTRFFLPVFAILLLLCLLVSVSAGEAGFSVLVKRFRNPAVLTEAAAPDPRSAAPAAAPFLHQVDRSNRPR